MRLKFNITQQFLIFFVITSIVPLAVISSFFFQAVDNKFNERISRMLDIGGLFAEEVYVTSLEKLSLGIGQSAAFSLRAELLQSFRNQSLEQVQAYLDRYRKLRGLDFIVLYTPSGQVMASSGWKETFFTPSVEAMVTAGLKGKAAQGLERFVPPSGGNISLYYLASAPIISDEGKVMGVLLASQPLVSNFPFQELVNAFPGLDMRIYTQSKRLGEFALLYSSVKGMPETVQAAQIEAVSKYEPQKYVPDDRIGESYPEEFQGETYKSKAVTLRNYLRQPVGYLVLSTSESDLKELKSGNIFYIGLYILFGLLIAGISGIWFKRSFINPVTALSNASEQVAKGQLDTEIKEQSQQQEIQGTIESFNRMVRQLHEDEKLRNTFVSTLTHDLRTPLIAQRRVLKMYTDFNNELPVELVAMNSQLLKNNEHLLDMVNKLLESYQYEAGKILLAPQAFSLHQLVDECMEEALPLAQAKNIRLANNVPKELPEIYADRYQLKRVFQNLIGNALENLHEDQQISVTARPWDGFITIDVEDNGPGIRPELIPHLFTRYFTGNRLRQKIGSGLGLYICRMIVELHEGTIEARSELGQGTLIRLRMPRKAAINLEKSYAR